MGNAPIDPRHPTPSPSPCGHTRRATAYLQALGEGTEEHQVHQAPQPPHDGRRPGLRNPAAGSASAQARPGPHRPRLASHTGGAPSARVKGEARAFLTADRDARAGRRRRGRACTRRETDEKGRARARRQMGRACARRGCRRPVSPSLWGPRPCRLRDPLRRPGLSVERRGRAGAEDLRGPGLRLRVSYTFSRVKDRALPPALPCLHV